MRRFLILCIVLVVSCGPKKSDQDVSAYQKMEFKDRNGLLPYRILLPKDYDKDKAYPLVLVLHGAGERGNDNESQLSYGADLFLQEDIRKEYPAIVVFPQCPEDGYWANVKKEQFLLFFTFTFYPDGEPTSAMKSLQGLLKNITENYKIDSKRMFVGGLSMGGMGTLELVRRNPGTFAAAFAICGGAHPDTAPQLVGTPLWLFHGDSDMVVDYEHSQKMAAALKKVGGEVKFTTYEDVNHNSWENAFVEPELLPWLFSHSLE
ncbi:carboxylesterase family protein [Ulvibacterium marinum]|uniref:Phospholipase n=1 Tax=Ulvibacterium marinum TaxID=2419782 RepID=A0A3B0C1I9_9FLAO|nr:prolyl oligopeptidase family serine peptidase [Ulvibacterium marinum]RKN78109.1 phospholipase [Ulvibacterium marinum]